MRCASCGSENPKGTKFCHECGGPLQNRCPTCGMENPLSAKFCGGCGAVLSARVKSAPAKSRKRQGTPTTKKAKRAAASPTAAKSHPAAPEAERRQLLAEIYGWFTEGFDTKDLQEAKVLLGELQGRS